MRIAITILNTGQETAALSAGERDGGAAVFMHLSGASLLGVEVILSGTARHHFALAGDFETLPNGFVGFHMIIFCLVQ